MTTQHTHPEHSDVDTGVTGHFFAPESNATSQDQAGTSSEPEQPSSVVEPNQPETGEAIAEEISSPEELGEAPGNSGVYTGEEEVRLFTDFIEEFLQSEERFQTSLQTYYGETQPSPGEGQEEPAPAPKEAPTSPLLRPPSRSRPPRHRGMRHREGKPVEEKQAAGTTAPAPVVSEEAQAAELTTRTAAEPAPQTASAEPATAPTTGEGEQPARPARRYRFDRPAAPPVPAAGKTPPASPAPVPIPAGQENGQAGEKEVATPAQGKSQEQSAQPQPVAQASEAAGAESSAAKAEERRKQGQEQQAGKEQAATQQAQEVAAPPAPATPQKEEVSPEELPPLEYSELQKASSRRRRRRRANNAAAAPTTSAPQAGAPEAPSTGVPGPSVATPVTPAATPPGQYSILSGYTVNQMNQGDGGGPFMPPEPSPARGSIAAQRARSVRTDMQRAPVAPIRPTEASPVSVQQLANVISHAFQVQTDRMIAELRHATQSPTNISVSLPPFPSNERVGVFVDVANLLYSARTLRITIDFAKLLDFLRGNRRLVRAHAYCPTSPQPGDEQMFLQAVKGLGYRITTKNYKTFSSGAKKADLDLDLCMDVVRLVESKSVDCIVLVSGDSDFMPMLDYCSDHGVRVEVAAFDEAMSASLRQSCDLFINLAMLEEIRA